MERASSNRIKGFDGLRAIAFLLVFISHKMPTPVSERIGSVAVWIFFVLSGFLITRILAVWRSNVEAGRVSHYEALVSFYRSRLFRIFPPYYALLAVLTVLAAGGHYDLESAGRQWANLLFYSNVYIERYGWYGELGHLWSLAVEQQYYLVFAPLVLFIPNIRIPWLCFALVIVSLASVPILMATGAIITYFDVNSFVNIGLFGMGGLAGLFANKPLPRWLANDLAAIVVFTLLLSVAVFVPNPYFVQVGRIPVGLFAMCLLLQISQRQQSVIVDALEFSAVRWVGKISYGAYLFHPVIHSAMLFSLFGIDNPLRRWTMVIDFVITIILASASWIFMEAPLNRLARQRSRALREEKALS
jgi:peptidoglycan/LPS O-acetylase OafA/YrhL